MKHVSWSYPVVCQTKKEDFIGVCKDAGGGDIISINHNSNLAIIKKIFRQNIHAQGRGFPLPELAAIFAKKSVYSPHNDTIGTKLWIRMIRRFAFNRFDRIIPNTEHGKKKLIKAGIKPEKITVIPLSVDYNLFSRSQGGNNFRKKHKLGKDIFALTTGIRILKNPDVISEACNNAGIKLVMIGPYKKKDLEKTWKGKGFEWYLPSKELLENKNIIFTGQLVGKEFLSALHAADIYVNSSIYETFGVAVYEAAAAGLALCLPDYGSFSNFNSCALFHKYNDPKSLCKNIKKYIDNPSLRKEYGSKSKTIAKSVDYSVVIKKYRDLYKDVGII